MVALAVVPVVLEGCSEVADPLNRPRGADAGACLDCHADQARLEATAVPDTSGGEPSGEG